MENIKNVFISIFAVIGGVVVGLLGGWDIALKSLLVFMIIDFLTGLCVAFVFKKSMKTDNGGLQSNICLKGIFKKCAILLAVVIATRLDQLMGGTAVCRTTVIFFFIGNEGLSIMENLGIMGAPIPKVLRDALEVLKKEKN